MKQFKYCPNCTGLLEPSEIEGRTRLLCTGCGWINYINPVPTTACVVRDTEGKILLVKRAVEPELGKWSIPSGFMEIDETPEDACLRELEEETGLKGKISGLIGVYVEPNETYGAVLTIGYLVEEIGGRLAPGDDASDVRFTAIKDADSLPFESHRKILRDLGR